MKRTSRIIIHFWVPQPAILPVAFNNYELLPSLAHRNTSKKQDYALPIKVIASILATEVNAFTRSISQWIMLKLDFFFFIENASSSWLSSHQLLCNCENDNMVVIHRCQNMASWANLRARYDKVRSIELWAPGDFHEDTYIQPGSLSIPCSLQL